MINVICDACSKEKVDAGERWFKVYNRKISYDREHSLDVTVDHLDNSCSSGEMIACSPKCCGKLIPQVVTSAVRHMEAGRTKDEARDKARKEKDAAYEAEVRAKMIEREANSRLKNRK